MGLKPYQVMVREAYCKLGEWRDPEMMRVNSIWYWLHHDSDCSFVLLESIYERVVNRTWRYKK